MKVAAAMILASMAAGSAAHAAIRCEDAPGREQRGVYWSWREIEGKRCWFIGARGAMPPKSRFVVKEKEEEPVDNDVLAAPENTKTGLAIQMLKLQVQRPFRCPGQLA